jgi:citrate lyase subunit beta / citryl-CoA lyase
VNAPLSWLYVPGDRPERFAKAAASGAHVVIIDLEDAVVPEHKDQARRETLAFLGDAAAASVEIRVNSPHTPAGRDDLAAITDAAALRAVRVPKVATASDVDSTLASLAAAETPLCCLIESALGVENAFAIASAPRVASIGLGEADLASDLGTTDAAGLAWPRSRVIVAARAAGLAAPAQSVYLDIGDLDGLRQTSLNGRAIGFRGRVAVHPRQIPVIHDAYRPSDHEVADATQVLSALASAREIGAGVVVLPNGHMVDEALRRHAEDILATASCLGTHR